MSDVDVFQTYAATGALGSGARSAGASPWVPFQAGRSRGEGMHSTTKSSRVCTPIHRAPEDASTGTMAQLTHALGQALARFLVGERARFKVLFQQRIVGRGDGLVQDLARLLGRILHVRGHLADGDFAPFVREAHGLHGHQIDDAFEARFLADGQLHGHRFGGSEVRMFSSAVSKLELSRSRRDTTMQRGRESSSAISQVRSV